MKHINKVKILITLFLILGASLTLVILNNNKHSKLNTNQLKSKKTNIAIYVCDEEGENCTNSSTTPSTGSYSLDAERSYCENGGTIAYNPSTKKITYSLLGVDECYVYLNESELAALQIASLAGTTGTDGSGNAWGIVEDHGIRYIGQNPSNFVWFNCSDLTNQNENTCERWRIIGVFNEKYDTNDDGKPDTEGNLVKIIRNDSLGDYYWDYKQSGVGSSTSSYGSNDWSDSQLMMMLNPPEFVNSGYVNETDANPVHNWTINGEYVRDASRNIYRNMGSYFDSGKTAYSPAKTTTSGFTSTTQPEASSFTRMNPLSQSMIATVKWHLTGWNSDEITANQFYNYERNINGMGTTSTVTRPKIWYGKIGLMYPSDYGFATSGNSSVSGFDRASCLNKELYYWADWSLEGVIDEFDSCPANSWLGYSNATSSSSGTYSDQWTITPDSTDVNDVIAVTYDGVVNEGNSQSSGGYSGTSYSEIVRPTLYLEPDVTISEGEGTYTSPYKLAQ